MQGPRNRGAKTKSLNLSGKFYMPRGFREWEDFLFISRAGKRDLGLERHGETKQERGCCYRSNREARSDASCWHERGTPVEWIYSIGFRRKEIRLAVREIHHKDYQLEEQGSSSHRSQKGQTLRYTLIDACMLTILSSVIIKLLLGSRPAAEINCWKKNEYVCESACVSLAL